MVGVRRDQERQGSGSHSRCRPTPSRSALCPEKFNKHIVSYQDLAHNPGLLDDPNLVVKVNEK